MIFSRGDIVCHRMVPSTGMDMENVLEMVIEWHHSLLVPSGLPVELVGGPLVCRAPRSWSIGSAV